MGYEFQPEDILAPYIYQRISEKTCIQNPNASNQNVSWNGSFRLMNFSHLAVAIVAVLAAFALFEMKLAVTILKRYVSPDREASGGSCPARCDNRPSRRYQNEADRQCSLTEASPAVMSSSH